MTKKTEVEKIYDDWLVGYTAKKLFWAWKKVNSNLESDENKEENVPDEKVEQQVIKPVIKKPIPKKTVTSSKKSEVKKPILTIKDIQEDFKEIEKEIPKKTNVKKKENRDIFLNDIKETLDSDKISEKNVSNHEISEIFKTNIALQQLLSNKTFKEDIEFIEIDDHFVTYVGAWSTNLSVDGNMLGRMSAHTWIGNFSIHSIFQPVDVLYSKKVLSKKKKSLIIEISIQREKKWADQVDPELENALVEITWIINWLVSQDFKMYRYYNIIQLVDTDKEKLLERRDQLEVLFETLNYDLIKFKHLQEPIHNIFGIWWNHNKYLDLSVKDRIPNIFTTDENLSYIDQFIYKEDNSVEWIPLWVDIFADRMICRDFWTWDNYNMWIFWSSWSWKSYTAKLVALREFNDWVKQIIIDPDWEFEWLTTKIWKDYINIGWDVPDNEKLNPFDFNFPRVLMDKHGVEHVSNNLDLYWEKIKEEYNSFVSNIKNLISIIIHNEKVSNTLYSEISTLLTNFFAEEWWINPKDVTSYFWIAKTPLNIKRFYKYLDWEVKNGSVDSDKISIIKKWLFDYADESWNYSRFLWEWRTNVNFKSDWTAFNLKKVSDPWLKTVITFIIISFIKQIFAERQTQRTRILIDEASTFLWANIEIAWAIAVLFQRARKYYMWITVIAQWLDNLFVDFKSEEKETNYWNTFVQNMENTIILAQKPNALKIIHEKLDLTEMQYGFLANLKYEKEDKWDVKWKALIMTWTSVDQIQIIPESYIHKYINTDPASKNKN